MLPEENQKETQLENNVIEKKSANYSFLLTLVALLILTGIFGIYYFSSLLPQIQNEVYAEENNTPKIIGGDKDEYGCLIAAGYSWCETKNKCLRTWEEACE
ncbi:MAG: hypothetical protein JW740_02970 [Candidatus Zambryskibacteria bacterium]|nr:hypothetical protein [Candidatus Zambryskibacteria bacterium]